MNYYQIFSFFLYVGKIFAGGSNIPRLCPNVKWNNNESIVEIANGTSSSWTRFLIDENNQMFLLDEQTNQITVHSLKHANSTDIPLAGESHPTSIFRQGSGHVHVATKGQNQFIYSIEPTSGEVKQQISINETCWDLFFAKGEFYCSARESHQVIVYSNDIESDPIRIYGEKNECQSTSTTFCLPSGIFVHGDNLYVADANNSRIQLFRHNETEGQTFIGRSGTINYGYFLPSSIIMDDHVGLWIAQYHTNKILRCLQKDSTCHCMVACDSNDDQSERMLSSPTHITFDRYGNLYVLQSKANIVLKYTLERNTCYFYPDIKICTNSTWKEDAVTFANQTDVGYNPRAIFIDQEMQIYVANHYDGRIVVWENEKSIPSRILYVNISKYSDLFVGRNGDVYFESGLEMGRIEKWSINSNVSVPVAKFPDNCYGLFIDHNHTLYCSLHQMNKVMKISLDEPYSLTVNDTQTNTQELGSDQLKNPSGIFIDDQFLYVADTGNNRIQRFPIGKNNGTTMAGYEIPHGFNLSNPTDIYINSKNEIFIADDHQHRIVRVLGNVSRVVVGITGQNGATSNKLDNAVGFQIAGSLRHLFVADENNHRIQKFHFQAENCDEPGLQISTEETSSLSIVSSTSSTNTAMFLTSCELMPCGYGRNCTDDGSFLGPFTCQCPVGTGNNMCQYDDRPCEPNPCRNGNTCFGTSKFDHYCQCDRNWTGRFCEIKVNFCSEKTCYNKGQCRPLLGYAVCDCLPGSYTGDQCEIQLKKFKIARIVSKSVAYIAIIALCSVALFVIVMDILKYFFCIDPVADDREQLRQEKRCRRPHVQHFIYVNGPNDLRRISEEQRNI